jgi:membrane protease YdiL (CAAX protease family)
LAIAACWPIAEVISLIAGEPCCGVLVRSARTTSRSVAKAGRGLAALRVHVLLEPKRFCFSCPSSWLLTSIQASAEELLFRGYLLQGTGLVTRRTVLLTVVNGVLFAVLHLSNPEVGRGSSCSRRTTSSSAHSPR